MDVAFDDLNEFVIYMNLENIIGCCFQFYKHNINITAGESLGLITCSGALNLFLSMIF